MKPVREREARFAGICGIFTAVLGLGNLICGSILLGYNVMNGDGMWSGLGMIVTGAVGIVIWRTKFRPAMMVFLLMSSVLAIALIIQIALAVIGFVFWRHFSKNSSNCYIYVGNCRCTTSDGKKIPIPLKSCDLIAMFDDVYLALILFSILSFLVTSAGSFIGCLSTCFEDMQEPKRQLTVNTQPTDLELEIQQVQEPESPKPSTSHDDNTKKTDTMEKEVQEKDENKNEEKHDETCENVYEVIVEKAA